MYSYSDGCKIRSEPLEDNFCAGKGEETRMNGLEMQSNNREEIIMVDYALLYT